MLLEKYTLSRQFHPPLRSYSFGIRETYIRMHQVCSLVQHPSLEPYWLVLSGINISFFIPSFPFCRDVAGAPFSTQVFFLLG